MKKATIIMPVYNGEQFLRRSVRDVFRQDYESVELIAIDDGSSDGSLKLLRRLAKAAPAHVEMRVFTQENAGICSTRNRGLDLAAGDYIFFMDQDDRMPKDSLSSLIFLLENFGSDMVIGGHLLVDESGRILEKWVYSNEYPCHKFRNAAPWGRVFRRDTIEKKHLRFMQTKISEDFYFNLVYMSCCRDILMSSRTSYIWMYRAASESHRNMSTYALDRNPLPMLEQTLRDMEKPNSLEPELLEYMFIKHIVWYLLFTAKGVEPQVLRTMISECFGWLDKHFPEWKKNKPLNTFGPAGESLKVRTAVRAATLMQRTGTFLPALIVYSRL